MKLLLLGSRGQLGSDLVRAAAREDGFCVQGLDRSALDVRNAEKLRAALAEHSFDALVNCTSYHNTDEAESNAGLALSVNAHAVAIMAECCRRKRARFVHVSTDYVFGGLPAKRPLTEDAPTAPLNIYGLSKSYGETLLRQSGADALVLRVASLFGAAGARSKGGNFVESMIRLGKERGALRVVADQHMSPTSSADAAAMLLGLLRKGAPPGIYHAVNSGQASWFEFAGEILRRAGVAVELSAISSSEYPTAARRPAYSVLCNAKLAAILGPPRPWQHALDDYLRARVAPC